jgi:hypothetical protein
MRRSNRNLPAARISSKWGVAVAESEALYDSVVSRVIRLIQDAVSQTGGMAIVIAAAAIFVAAAIGGLTIIGSLGTFGYVAYFVVLAVLALALGPVLATGITIRRKGSAHHREEAAQRLEAQRRKFGLVSPEADRERARLEGDRTDPPH